jgi:hypothetical protein
MAEIGEADTGNKSHIARADDGNFHDDPNLDPSRRAVEEPNAFARRIPQAQP